LRPFFGSAPSAAVATISNSGAVQAVVVVLLLLLLLLPVLRCWAFKLSPDPQFIDKVRDVVGLYLDKILDSLAAYCQRINDSGH
jgi:hypothetical protein